MNQRLLKTGSQWSHDQVYLGWDFMSIRYVLYAPWTLSAPLLKPAVAAVIISAWLQSASFRCNLGGPGLSCSEALLTLWRGALQDAILYKPIQPWSSEMQWINTLPICPGTHTLEGPETLCQPQGAVSVIVHPWIGFPSFRYLPWPPHPVPWDHILKWNIVK